MSVLRRLKTRYYVPSPGQPLPVRAWRYATRRRVPAFPRNVQIQTLTGCNGACVFCPYPRTVESQPKGFMSEELFRKIVDEIATHPVRRVSPYLMNEPFLDPRLLDRIAYIRKKAPKARVVVTTNGSRLSPEVCERLLESGGLHALCISFQGVV